VGGINENLKMENKWNQDDSGSDSGTSSDGKSSNGKIPNGSKWSKLSDNNRFVRGSWCKEVNLFS
jgi:hypothetical protein